MSESVEPRKPARRTADLAGRKRQNNRRGKLLAAANKLFASKGLDGTSMRDIATETGMLPGSLYYYFVSKDDLFEQVHADAMDLIAARVDKALETLSDPWERLEAAAAAHLEGLLEVEGSVVIVTPNAPSDKPQLAERLKAQRDAYEERFARLVSELPLPGKTNRSLFRLMLLGSLNWATLWYKPGKGKMKPAEIGRHLVRLMRQDA